MVTFSCEYKNVPKNKSSMGNIYRKSVLFKNVKLKYRQTKEQKVVKNNVFLNDKLPKLLLFKRISKMNTR